MTRVLVTGGSGQLGRHLAGAADVVALSHAELDITDAELVDAVLAEHAPDVVINAAAYTAVDAAEEDEATAALVNETGPRLLAETLARRGGRLVHISTDYVFDGTATTPYEPADPVGPRTVYGRTKLAGEHAARSAHDRVVIVRTAWVYGGPSPNFVDTMRRLERERDTVDVVADQTGSPTWVADLAVALLELAAAPVESGVYHYVNTGTATWFDLARETFRLVGADSERVRPVTSAAFPRPAPRPAWSVLSISSWRSLGLRAPRPWQAALADYLAGARPD